MAVNPVSYCVKDRHLLSQAALTVFTKVAICITINKKFNT